MSKKVIIGQGVPFSRGSASDNLLFMETLLKNWGGESIIVKADLPTGCMIIIAIHSTTLGPATGGTRMMRYKSFRGAVKDAMNLSQSMTYKFALAGFHRGGGKAVIITNRVLNQDDRHGLFLRYGDQVKKLGGYFFTGPDVGTSSTDMDIISATGAPFVFSRTRGNGGAGGSGEATAFGVLRGIQATCGFLFGSEDLYNKTILVQGVGNVGKKLIEYLAELGATILYSDIDPALKGTFPEHKYIESKNVYTTPCDIFSPCGLGGILNRETTSKLKCKGIVGAANNQLTSDRDAVALQERGIIYAPDFAVNIGGAVAITAMEAMNWSKDDAFNKVSEVGHTLLKIYSQSMACNTTTVEAARFLAKEMLSNHPGNAKTVGLSFTSYT